MESIIDLVCELKKKCIESDNQFIAKLDISDSEYNFMKALINCRHLNSKAVAKRMGLSLSRVSRILDSMVQKGYVLRWQDEKDRRTINIRLSDKGEELKIIIVKFRQECDDKIFASLPENEINLLQNSLKTIISVL